MFMCEARGTQINWMNEFLNFNRNRTKKDIDGAGDNLNIYEVILSEVTSSNVQILSCENGSVKGTVCMFTVVCGKVSCACIGQRHPTCESCHTRWEVKNSDLLVFEWGCHEMPQMQPSFLSIVLHNTRKNDQTSCPAPIFSHDALHWSGWAVIGLILYSLTSA